MILPLYEFDYNFDKEKLLEEALVDKDYHPFFDYKNNREIDGWKHKFIDSGYGKELTESFVALTESKEYKMRFYVQTPGYEIEFHKDRGTLCSINLVLSDSADPIRFVGAEYTYKIALLNTQAYHAVSCLTSPRVLYKFSILDKSYEEVRDVLQSKLLGR